MLSRADLHPYQHRAARHVVDVPRCALWLDMGLGKSVSTLTGLVDLRAAFETNKTLVVAPLRVARKVWTDEITTWCHVNHLTYARIIGNEAKRWAAINTEANIHLVNRENVQWLEAQYIDTEKMKQFRLWPWDTVVLDEAQSFKSQSSKRFASMRRLTTLCERVIELTGTPAPNGYKDLWAQIFLLDRGKRLGKTEQAFLDRWFEKKPNGYGVQLKEHAAEEIQELLADIVLTMRAEDYLDLPPVQSNYIKVDLSGPVMQKYRELERAFLAEFNSRTVTAVNAGVAAGKLLQVANGAVYYDDKQNYVEIHDAKLDALEEVLDATSGPVLIAYGFKHDLARLKRLMDKYCPKNDKTWDVLKTKESEEKWNRGETDYLLLHPASAGHGLNLQKSGSETIVWFGLTNNLELYAQLNARLIGGHRRTGRNVIIHHIVAENTVDTEVLIPLLNDKDATQEDLKIKMVEKARALQ